MKEYFKIDHFFSNLENLADFKFVETQNKKNEKRICSLSHICIIICSQINMKIKEVFLFYSIGQEPNFSGLKNVQWIHGHYLNGGIYEMKMNYTVYQNIYKNW